MDQIEADNPEFLGRFAAIQDAPSDIRALGYFAFMLWGITTLWLVLIPDGWLDSVLKTEANVWLLVLSGVFFLLLAVAWTASWWPVILAVVNCLLAVNLVLRRKSARVRWVCATVAAMLIFPVAMHFWPGGIDSF